MGIAGCHRPMLARIYVILRDHIAGTESERPLWVKGHQGLQCKTMQGIARFRSLSHIKQVRIVRHAAMHDEEICKERLSALK